MNEGPRVELVVRDGLVVIDLEAEEVVEHAVFGEPPDTWTRHFDEARSIHDVTLRNSLRRVRGQQVFELRDGSLTAGVTGGPRRRLTPLADGASVLAVVGRDHLVVGFESGEAQLVSAAGRTVSCAPFEEAVTAAAPVGDRFVALGDANANWRILSIEDFGAEPSSHGFDGYGPVAALAAPPDGASLAMAHGTIGRIKWFRVDAQGRAVGSRAYLKLNPACVSLALPPSGAHLAAGFDDGSVRVLCRAVAKDDRLEVIWSFPPGTSAVREILFPDEERILWRTDDDTLFLAHWERDSVERIAVPATLADGE